MMTIPNWLPFALGSAIFAALTAVFGKLGVSDINSSLATLIRTVVILGVTCSVVTMRHEWQPPGKLSLFSCAMLIASGVATGLSWFCYYRALQLGPASKVVPIDKLSVVFVVIASVLLLHETLTLKLALGSFLIATGAVIIAL